MSMKMILIFIPTSLGVAKMVVCNNCETTQWVAKNDVYCTECAKSWHATYVLVCSTQTNPKQSKADKILEEFGVV